VAIRRSFRRRKPTVAWLPVLGQGSGSTNLWLEGLITVLPGGGATNISTTIHALVVDYPAEAVQTAQVETLADYQGSGYRLRRIVGKFNCGLDQPVGDGQTSYPNAVLVGAGLIVLRVDSATGAPLRAATPGDYSPLARDNVRDPWIWRRTWLLGADLASTPTTTAGGFFPETNSYYGSAADGPHIDQKTARRIGAEERLILAVSTVYLNELSGAATTANTVRYCYEARYLTSPLRVNGNKRNASR